MGLEFLVRVRTTTLWIGALSSLLAAPYIGASAAGGFAAGAAWSLANLRLIEWLVVTLTGPARRSLSSPLRAGLALLATLALFGVGAVLLNFLPAMWLVAGFLLPFVVITAKAATRLLLASPAWAALVRHRWRATLAVLALAGAAWLAVGVLPSAGVASPGRGARAIRLAAAPAAHEAPAAGAETSENKGPEGFPNVIGVLAKANPRAGWAHWLEHYEVLIYSLFVALLLCWAAHAASRNPQMIPTPFQNAVEAMVEALSNFIVGILGPKHGPRYVPFLGSLFVYILAMNLFGLIPFMHSPTSSLNVTVALALTVFVYVQYTGFRELGVVGYFDHLLGSPRDVTGWLLAPLMLPIHVLGELAKPISLSCRLFGNVFGEDMLLVAFASLGVTVMSFTHLPIGLPLQLPFLFLALLSSTLQALVFTVLSTIYFLLMLPHDDHGHEGEAQHAH